MKYSLLTYTNIHMKYLLLTYINIHILTVDNTYDPPWQQEGQYEDRLVHIKLVQIDEDEDKIHDERKHNDDSIKHLLVMTKTHSSL